MKAKLYASKQTVTILLFTCLCGSALAQNYVIEYESAPGFRLGVRIEPFDRDRRDFNGDGIAELTLLQVDEQGNAVAMNVIEVKTGATLWTFDVQALVAAGFRFKGFFDIDADGVREPAFFSRDASTYIIIDPLTNTAELEITGVARASVADVDKDGQNELIVGNRDTRTVQVYGTDPTTAVTEQDLIIAGFQLEQNYPNPFNPSTTISYSVERTGEITLKIYDLLGRYVRTLVNDSRKTGEYSVVWDGKDDLGGQVASGHYFYRLTTGEFQSTRRMLLLK